MRFLFKTKKPSDSKMMQALGLGKLNICISIHNSIFCISTSHSNFAVLQIWACFWLWLLYTEWILCLTFLIELSNKIMHGECSCGAQHTGNANSAGIGLQGLASHIILCSVIMVWIWSQRMFLTSSHGKSWCGHLIEVHEVKKPNPGGTIAKSLLFAFCSKNQR